MFDPKMVKTTNLSRDIRTKVTKWNVEVLLVNGSFNFLNDKIPKKGSQMDTS